MSSMRWRMVGESIPGRSDMCKGPVAGSMAHWRNGKKVVWPPTSVIRAFLPTPALSTWWHNCQVESLLCVLRTQNWPPRVREELCSQNHIAVTPCDPSLVTGEEPGQGSWQSPSSWEGEDASVWDANLSTHHRGESRSLGINSSAPGPLSTSVPSVVWSSSTVCLFTKSTRHKYLFKKAC